MSGLKADLVGTESRFWAKVSFPDGDGCWIWKAGRNAAGYGRYRLPYRTALAHRYAYEALVGEIPAGLVIDHLCRTHACVNPAHLEPVTNRENVRRGLSTFVEERGTCAHGHPINSTNSRFRADGYLHCRPCQREATARWSAKRVAAGLPPRTDSPRPPRKRVN